MNNSKTLPWLTDLVAAGGTAIQVVRQVASVHSPAVTVTVIEVALLVYGSQKKVAKMKKHGLRQAFYHSGSDS